MQSTICDFFKKLFCSQHFNFFVFVFVFVLESFSKHPGVPLGQFHVCPLTPDVPPHLRGWPAELDLFLKQCQQVYAITAYTNTDIDLHS